eukprot:TRINITY_DN28578_c0_g1_i1.p1 TRINITY_DN28578_c0_g1~~TRINITY_DN28578_c0_g1_i1.p1  ORF type:complete len:238 (-),score=49.55 TRINITY_DN28578_c0_g1_i1:64-777(-)
MFQWCCQQQDTAEEVPELQETISLAELPDNLATYKKRLDQVAEEEASTEEPVDSQAEEGAENAEPYEFSASVTKRGLRLGMQLDIITEYCVITEVEPGQAVDIRNWKSPPEKQILQFDRILKAQGSDDWVGNGATEAMRKGDPVELVLLRPRRATLRITRRGRKMGLDIAMGADTSRCFMVLNVLDGVIKDDFPAGTVSPGDVVIALDDSNGRVETRAEMLKRMKGDEFTLTLCCYS